MTEEKLKRANTLSFNLSDLRMRRIGIKESKIFARMEQMYHVEDLFNEEEKRVSEELKTALFNVWFACIDRHIEENQKEFDSI